MKTVDYSFQDLVNQVPEQIKLEIDLEFAISNRIHDLMMQRGLSKTDLAKALNKRPSEITKWLSGQHNFTIKTIALLSCFFKENLLNVNG